jgi:hypothetical protein
LHNCTQDLVALSGSDGLCHGNDEEFLVFHSWSPRVFDTLVTAGLDRAMNPAGPE